MKGIWLGETMYKFHVKYQIWDTLHPMLQSSLCISKTIFYRTQIDVLGTVRGPRALNLSPCSFWSQCAWHTAVFHKHVRHSVKKTATWLVCQIWHPWVVDLCARSGMANSFLKIRSSLLDLCLSCKNYVQKANIELYSDIFFSNWSCDLICINFSQSKISNFISKDSWNLTISPQRSRKADSYSCIVHKIWAIFNHYRGF